jgi:hypothetical protein
MTMPLGNVTGSVETSAAAASLGGNTGGRSAHGLPMRTLLENHGGKNLNCSLFIRFGAVRPLDSARSGFNPAAFHGMDARPNRRIRQATTEGLAAFEHKFRINALTAINRNAFREFMFRGL